jgi:hypothetical protein
MEAMLNPLGRRVESALQKELDTLNALPPAEQRQRIRTLFERPPDLQPAAGMAREIVRAGGQRLVARLAQRLGEEPAVVRAALDDYVAASERFVEPVLLRHMSAEC